MSTANRVAANTGILYARMAITVFISLYSTKLVLEALGVTDFGVFNVVGGIVAMLTFLNTAMASATQRFISYAEGLGDLKKIKTIFNVSMVLHLIIAVIIFFLFEIAGYFLFDGVLKIPEGRLEASKLVFQFAIASTLLTIISVPYDAVINAHENMLLFAILGVAEALLKLAIALIITHTEGDKLILYGFLMAFLSILLLISKWIYCSNKYVECKIKLRQYFDMTSFKEMTSFASWSFLGASTSMISNYGQGIVMNVFFGTAVNAAQAISGQVSGQLGAFATTMLKALNPMLAKSEGAGNRSLMIRASVTGSKISFFLLMFFIVPVLIDMPYIFSLWLDSVPEYVVVFCRLLLVRNLIEQLFLTLKSSIVAEGNIRAFQIYTSILSFFPLVISSLLFSLGYPPYSLYIVFIIYSTLSSFLILYFANKNFGLSVTMYFNTVIIRCFGTFAVIFVVTYIPMLLPSEGITRLLLILTLNFLSFVLVVWFVGFSREEKVAMRNVATNGLKKMRLLMPFLK